MNPEVVLSADTLFESGQGMPCLGCGLMQASNGLIYYLTQENNFPYRSRIMALDPVTDSTWVDALLGTPDFPYRGQRAFTSLMEGVPGSLVDATSNMTYPTVVYRFDLTTKVLSVIAQIPTGVNTMGNIVRPTLMGTLAKGANGKLYAGETPWELSSGRVIAIDAVAHTYTPVFDPQVAGPFEGLLFNGDMKQIGPKMYLTANKGGATYIGPPEGLGCGTISSFDLTTNTYHKELDLDSTAYGPGRGFVIGADGLLYSEGYTNITQMFIGGFNYNGCLFTYNPNTNTLQPKVNYTALLEPDITGPFLGSGLLSASNGKIYGSFRKGLFEYDPMADTLRLRAPLQYLHNGVPYPYGLSSPLIEICREPNYKPRSTTAFTVCAGSHFAYDLQNMNATGVVWRRNGELAAAQTNQRLEFAAITAADAGTWACTMTNECGTTEPPPITITVQTGSYTASTIGGDTLLCGTGDSAVLTGNNGGTWNTGATTPTLVVTEPGLYYVTQQNACGSSMSNIIHVMHLDSAAVPPTVYWDNVQYQGTTAYICPGQQEFTFTGNGGDAWGLYTPGIWSTGDTGPSITVQDTGLYYVSATNACNTDSVFVKHVLPTQAPPLPEVATTDGQGNPVDAYLCGNESLFLQSDAPQAFWLYDSHGYQVALLGGSFPVPYQVDSGGTYYVVNAACGQIVDTLTITIHHADGPPVEAPVILPDVDVLAGCELDTVHLGLTGGPAYWSWLGPDGQLQRDSSSVLLVDWGVNAYFLTTFNGCGDGAFDAIGIEAQETPEVNYEQAVPLVCLNDAPFPFTPGTPAGGTYSGTGVVGNTFSPALAGAGTHAITYSFGEGNCAGQATANITVDLCTGVAEAEDGGGIRVDPNPNDGAFRIHIDRAFKEGSLLMYDASGKRVGQAMRLMPGSNTIHQNGLAPGVYQLRMEFDGQVEKRSVVITSQ